MTKRLNRDTLKAVTETAIDRHNKIRKEMVNMKRLIALLLAAVLALSLAACGGETGESPNSGNETSTGETTAPVDTTEPQEEPTVKTNWEVVNQVDEFGDVIENGDTLLATTISGEFSNTATNSSELSGVAGFIPYGDEYILSLDLDEYGNSPVTYSDSDLRDGIILKTKIGDTISEYELYGTAPTGNLMLMEDARLFFTDFYDNSEDARCIINIGSSEYNFTIEYGNFASACDEAFNIPAGDIQSDIDAIRALLAYSRHIDCYNYFSENINNYPIVTTDELSNIIQNRWLRIEIRSQFNDWYMFEYTSDGTRTQIGRFDNGVYETSNESSQGNYPYRIENNSLYTGTFLGGEDAAQFRKISDGYYLVSEGSDTLYLYIQYNEDGVPTYSLG